MMLTLPFNALTAALAIKVPTLIAHHDPKLIEPVSDAVARFFNTCL